MREWTRRLVIFGLLLVWVLPAHAQNTEIEELSIDKFRDLIRQTEEDPDLAEDDREEIITIYEIAIENLGAAESARMAVAGYLREINGIDREILRLREEIEKPEQPPTMILPKDPNFEQVRDALAEERARLAAHVSELREVERSMEDASKNRSDIMNLLGNLDAELSSLDGEIRNLADYGSTTEFDEAVRYGLRARREFVTNEIDRLRVRLTLLSERSILNPLDIEVVRRRVTASEALAARYETLSSDLWVELARESLDEVLQSTGELALEVPVLDDFLTDIEFLATTLWGPEGIHILSEQTAKELETARRHVGQLDRIAELTARKYKAYGIRENIQRWWPEIPPDFPQTGAAEATLERLNKVIPDVEHNLISFEEQRAGAPDYSRDIMDLLRNTYGENVSPQTIRKIRNLLTLRQDLLDQTIRKGGEYSLNLSEHRTIAARYLEKSREVESFLYTRILWSRSVAPPLFWPRRSSLREALEWFVSFGNTDATAGGFRIRFREVLALLLVVFLVWLKRPVGRRFATIAGRIGVPVTDRFRYTLEAAALTFIIAAPLPLGLLLAANLAGRMGETNYWFASAEAFRQLAQIAMLFAGYRQILRPWGLAPSHFGWPISTTEKLRKGLLIVEAVGFPLLYIALHFAFAGIRLNSPPDLAIFNNTLGRLAFVVGLFFIGFVILALIRPVKKTEISKPFVRVPWPQQLSIYAFPTAFLGAYPLIILTTIIPAALAIAGFYITGLLLAYQMLRTLVVVTFVLVGGGILHRAGTVRLGRLEENKASDMARDQYQVVSRFIVLAVLFIGLVTIWNDAIPLLQYVKRVQILPKVAILETEETLSAAATEIAPNPGEETAKSGPALPAPVGPAPPAAETSESDSALETVAPTLTLWEVLQAVLAALVTFVLVRNVPAVIEVFLQRRTTMAVGGRLAMITLLRYAITIVGVVVFFGYLGVSWSKIQWLAAALTFGIGFGLQEIVANFVSGLVLLVERPVRVGDIVTVGTLMGEVSRIQIRATTITLWDRSEMVVPNKEFITTKLVNWTLSNSKRRIEIPLRMAYGIDPGQVKRLLVEIAEAHPAVLDDPAPYALLLSFDDDAIKFELRFVVEFTDGIQTKDDVQMAIDAAFKKLGMKFALPKLEVTMPQAEAENTDPTP